MKSLSRAERIAYSGVFLCLALLLSYIESIISLNFILPVPGIKIGLANLAVMAVFYFISPALAVLVSFGRVALAALLFGTPVSFLFSLFGAVFAFLPLLLHKYLLKDKISYVGASIFAAAMHLIGQGLCGIIILGDESVFYYISVILPLSVLTGGILGFLLLSIGRMIKKGKGAS